MKYLVIIFFSFVYLPVLGQIKRVLLDSITKAPIAYATIYDSTSRVGTHSDEEGYFVFNCQKSIMVSHILYQNKHLLCNEIQDTILIAPREFMLNPVEIVAKKMERKVKKTDIVYAGVGNSKSRMQYEGIKEAALFIQNPFNMNCYIHKIFFSFSKVKFDDGRGTIKDKDILVMLKLYKKSISKSEPGEQILQSQLTYRLEANSTKLEVDLTDMAVLFPPQGGFISIEFLGYFEGDEFRSLNFNDVNIRKQFAPDLSNKHQIKNSYYRKTFSDEWDRVNVDVEGFFNFNFGIELIKP